MIQETFKRISYLFIFSLIFVVVILIMYFLFILCSGLYIQQEFRISPIHNLGNVIRIFRFAISSFSPPPPSPPVPISFFLLAFSFLLYIWFKTLISTLPPCSLLDRKYIPLPVFHRVHWGVPHDEVVLLRSLLLLLGVAALEINTFYMISFFTSSSHHNLWYLPPLYIPMFICILYVMILFLSFSWTSSLMISLSNFCHVHDAALHDEFMLHRLLRLPLHHSPNPLH